MQRHLAVAADWFVNLDTATAITSGVSRNKDGSINMNGFLALTNKAPADAGARLSAAEWLNLFTDVSESDRFYDNVAYVARNGLMIGVGNGRFNPDGAITGGMLLAFLARLDGVDTNSRIPWYQAGMEWAVQKGISDSTNLDAVITREEFVASLWHYAGEPAATGSLASYSDAGDVHSQAASAMVWAVQKGIIQDTGGKLDPLGGVSRAEAATMLARFCQNVTG